MIMCGHTVKLFRLRPSTQPVFVTSMKEALRRRFMPRGAIRENHFFFTEMTVNFLKGRRQFHRIRIGAKGKIYSIPIGK